jgi:membrane protein
MLAPDMSSSAQPEHPEQQRNARALLKRTLAKAWEGNIFSEAAEAAFWQTLSLPPLLLGLLGCVGFLGDWFGKGVVAAVQSNIIKVCQKVFSPNVVTTIIEPTVSQILTTAQGEIASIGFLISLWAGSSAMSSFVDAITVAHDQYGVRNDVWQRIYALLLYLVGLVLAVIGLPLLAVGPTYLPNFFPTSWRAEVSSLVGVIYYPALAVLIVLALTTLYKMALPRKLPWHRGLPGAGLAMVVFILSSIGLRIYIAQITKTGYTYGALAAPIAFLLLTFFIGLAIVAGAHFNAALQELWPARMTRRQRLRWRRLEMVRTQERISRDQAHEAWKRAETPAEPTKPVRTNGNQPTTEQAADSPAGDSPAGEKFTGESHPGRRRADTPPGGEKSTPEGTTAD